MVLMSEMLETYIDDQDDWPHISQQRASRWHLPQLAVIEAAPTDEADVPTVEYTAVHDGKILVDAMSVTFE